MSVARPCVAASVIRRPEVRACPGEAPPEVSPACVATQPLRSTAMLLGGLPLNSTAAALDAVMSASSGGAPAPAPEAPPAHWTLDDILWSPEAMAAIAAAPGNAGGGGGGGGALRPALLATPEGGGAKAAPVSSRRAPLRSATCQALGCSAPLEAPYYLRNRLCPAHVRAEQLWLAPGQPQRFCQARPSRCLRAPTPRFRARHAPRLPGHRAGGAGRGYMRYTRQRTHVLA